MSTTPNGPHGRSEAAALIELHGVLADHLPSMLVAEAARQLREIFPSATAVLVDTADWHYERDLKDVAVVAVLDGQAQSLWADTDTPPGTESDVDTRWDVTRQAARTALTRALEHTDPSVG